MLLIFRRKFGKIAAPAPDADNQVAVFFRVGDGVFKHRSVKDIQLQLLVAEFDEIFYQAGQFFDAVVRFENGWRKFNGYRAAVHNPRIVNDGIGLEHAENAVDLYALRRCQAGGKGFAVKASVGRGFDFWLESPGRIVVDQPDVIHGRAAAGADFSFVVGKFVGRVGKAVEQEAKLAVNRGVRVADFGHLVMQSVPKFFTAFKISAFGFQQFFQAVCSFFLISQADCG